MDNYLSNIYQAICKEKDHFGKYTKSCIHIHTPESYDYRLLQCWTCNDYKSKNEEDILDECYKRGALPDSFSLSSLEQDSFNGYKDKKEFLSFLLLATEIINNQYGLVVVTDHNTCKGVEKLKKSIAEITKFKSCTVFPEIIFGVEISCADKNHVVGIFNSAQEEAQEVNKWLDENLFNVEEGSFRTSMDVLKFLKDIGGIGYIAHINSSSILNKDNYSGAYKKELFKNIKILGLSDLNKKSIISEKIKPFSDRHINYIIDNDAHCIEELKNNAVWIKSEKNNFCALKEAFCDFDVSVRYSEPDKTKLYIKGIYIKHRDNGFLSAKDKKSPLCITFSDELNCFIGGRGTGKSTVLEMIEYSLSQRCKSSSILDLICSHGNTYILYGCEEKEYLIEVRMPSKEGLDSILQCFGENLENRYRFYYSYDSEKIKKYARKKYISVYSVIKTKDVPHFDECIYPQTLLESFFDTKYSVNELVNTASSDEISNFIYNTLLKNSKFSAFDYSVNARSIAAMRQELEKLQCYLDQRKSEINSIISDFNQEQLNILRISYNQANDSTNFDFLRWPFKDGFRNNLWFEYNGKKYNIKNKNVGDYLNSLCSKTGLIGFLKLCIDKDVNNANVNESLQKYCTKMSQNMIDDEINEINKNNYKDIIRFILCKTVNSKNITSINRCLRLYVDEIEEFKLEFNINGRETTSTVAPAFRDVRCLSLGQKVVAMLSFVLAYSDYSLDYRPLIIDQPEDNLDNQYIYKSLVNQIRKAKEKRQVIIATHNATLVTNTRAEHVCVMESDGVNGWPETRGYTGTPKIKKNIINYLEGGEESFKHKFEIYQEVL